MDENTASRPSDGASNDTNQIRTVVESLAPCMRCLAFIVTYYPGRVHNEKELDKRYGKGIVCPREKHLSTVVEWGICLRCRDYQQACTPAPVDAENVRNLVPLMVEDHKKYVNKPYTRGSREDYNRAELKLMLQTEPAILMELARMHALHMDDPRKPIRLISHANIKTIADHLEGAKIGLCNGSATGRCHSPENGSLTASVQQTAGVSSSGPLPKFRPILPNQPPGTNGFAGSGHRGLVAPGTYWGETRQGSLAEHQEQLRRVATAPFPVTIAPHNLQQASTSATLANYDTPRGSSSLTDSGTHRGSTNRYSFGGTHQGMPNQQLSLPTNGQGTDYRHWGNDSPDGNKRRRFD